VAFIRQKKIRNTKGEWVTYYSLVERIKTGAGQYRIRTLESYGVEKPWLYRPFLFEGDCLAFTSYIPDQCVDVVFTDPPYWISSESRITAFDDPQRALVRDFGQWDHFTSLEAYRRFTQKWLGEVDRVLKKGGNVLIFFNINRFGDLTDFFERRGYTLGQAFVWKKTNPTPSVRKRKFQDACEYIFVAHKPGEARRFNHVHGPHHNLLETSIVSGYERKRYGWHPTQKPLELATFLLNYFSYEHDVVLDLFAGKATIPLAAARMKRQALGAEVNPYHMQNARRRLCTWMSRQKYTEWKPIVIKGFDTPE
jgi:DNA modification methylase